VRKQLQKFWDLNRLKRKRWTS